jgi:hypothetical protein
MVSDQSPGTSEGYKVHEELKWLGPKWVIKNTGHYHTDLDHLAVHAPRLTCQNTGIMHVSLPEEIF